MERKRVSRVSVALCLTCKDMDTGHLPY